MNNRFLWQLLGVFIFLCLLVAFNYYFEYLRKLQSETFQIYTTQANLGAVFAFTTGTVCLFLDQIIEKIKLKDKRFDVKILLAYALPALCILFSIEIYFSPFGVALGPWAKVFTYLIHTRALGAVLLGLGIVRALCPADNRVYQTPK